MQSDGNRRPLYNGARDARLTSTTVGNAGLWYDKFCDRWQGDWSGLGDSGKQDWIALIANEDGTAGKRVGNAELLREIAERQKYLVSARDGTWFRLASVWRFASGLGRSHPVENGFAWHHGLGTPYLPGSGVKGVARAWARWKLEDKTEEELRAEDVTRIFGPDEGAVAVGSVIFLDALPVEPVALAADVMTPHYSPWYQRGETPGDWHSPTPIPFLTVGLGQTFQFAVLPRTPADKADCETAATLLKGALQTLRAGAKTAAGYGVFGPLPDAFTHPLAGQRVDLPEGELRCVLLEKKTKKGGWMAHHIGSSIEGPIQGTAPPDCKPGDEVMLLRANRTDFKWPTEKDQQRLSTTGRAHKGKPAGKAGQKGRR